MRNSPATLVILIALISAGSACTEKAADATKKSVDNALDATKSGADKAIDATKNAGDKTAQTAQKTADKATEAAGKVADKTKEAVIATGNAVTDTWITGKLKAKFADESVLRASEIKISTSKHVVTLTGIVGSDAAKVRAGEIASGTEGVVAVVNQLVVK